MTEAKPHAVDLPVFDRNFWDHTFRFTRLGAGAIGGKASGLAFVKDLLTAAIKADEFPGVDVNVPTMAVIATDRFEQFISQNRLSELPFEDMTDARIGNAFQHAELPIELVGDLWALIAHVTSPLAIRSSSLLEDALDRPFAGVYATKMIPNNQFDTETRFRRLVEAVKFVYASTYFREARDYIRTTGRRPCDEKMAVIIQEVVGRRHQDRFYPDISGVARSYNFYPLEPARPEEGVASLALGLGKTIVDGEVCWTYSPAHPRRPPPFGSTRDLLRGTQTQFWAVNMGKPPAYDPINEVEYMTRASLAEAESDDVLHNLASTYDPGRDRVLPGVTASGPRVLDFAPLLVWQNHPVNDLIKALLSASEAALGAKVEIEFALTFHEGPGEQKRARLGFLQVRPMAVSDELVDISEAELEDPHAVVVSDMVMGNGIDGSIRDIVFVRPENFSPMRTPEIAKDVERLNGELVSQGRHYLLIGFGRWGSSHPSLGIPVNWSQISGARTIVESTLPEMNVELSQGSHFFHNLTSFRATYFMVRHNRKLGVAWDWLNRQPFARETRSIRHVQVAEPLSVRVDGRSARGVIVHAAGKSET